MPAPSPPPASVSVAPVAVHPPLLHPVRWRVEQVQRAAGGDQRFAATLEARFAARPGGGYDMKLSTLAPVAGGTALFRIMMRAFAAVPLHVRLGPDGRPAEVIDGDAAWRATAAAVERGIAGARRANPGKAGADRALVAYGRAFAATPPAARTQTLLESARGVFGPLLPPLAPGQAQPFSEPGSDATGRPISMAGSVRRVPAPPHRLHVRFETAGGTGDARVVATRDVVVSAADGLLVRSVQTLAGGTDPHPFSTQRLTREP